MTQSTRQDQSSEFPFNGMAAAAQGWAMVSGFATGTKAAVERTREWRR